MNEYFGDARLQELKLLSDIDRCGELEVTAPAGPQRDLLAFLVQERLVNDPDPKPGTVSLRDATGLPGESELERSLHEAFLENLYKVLSGSSIRLRLSHRGRVRLSELKHALRAGREREPFGILWDKRYWEQEVQIAIWEAREGTPLALAYLDMNGLKQINDRHGHDAGDLALKAYFQAVASVLGDRGQAYRLGDGADEVLVVLPNCDELAAVQIIRLACNKLMSERLLPTDPNALLSIAAGALINSDHMASPTKLRSIADAEQRRAKARSQVATPRPSVIAISGKDDLIIIEHGPVVFPATIVGSLFANARNERGITFTVTNMAKEPLPPFKVGLFHPKRGSWFLFPSEKSGQLLQDQKRDFAGPVTKDGRVPEWFPKLTHASNGESLTDEDDAQFEFRLVLEDSDNKVLFRNKRIGRALAAIIRRAARDGADFGITSDHWNDLRYPAPGE